MSKSQRDKGSRNEREVARLYNFAQDRTDVMRELSQYQKSSGRDLKGCQPYCVQVKSGKAINTYAAFQEAVSAIDKEYTLPVLHMHLDRKTPIVVLDESYWMTIVELLKQKIK